MSEMKIMCSRCDKEVENASPYNFYVLHKECLRDYAKEFIKEFLEDLDTIDLDIPDMIDNSMNLIRKKWEAKKNEE